MLKEILAAEIYEKYKSVAYLIESEWEQSLINDLRLALILDKYGLPIPHIKIEHL